MGKKLAIRGHSARGKEVIEMMQIMGGSNIHKHTGNNKETFYYIDDRNDIDCDWTLWNNNRYTVFTLEEFYKKYPFKIGDKVIDLKTNKIAEVYKMHWSENTNCVYYDIKYPNNCGCTRRLMDLKSMDDNKDVHSIYECKTIGQGTYAIKIADGYKFDSIDENGNIIVKSIKPKYPTTYDDCCDMLNADEFVGYDLMFNFPKLINARNAYWKIAGEEMGLGKPWEPDWNDDDEDIFCIYNVNGTIYSDGGYPSNNKILVFPTEEIRDAFYENFKDLIEDCKELL